MRRAHVEVLPREGEIVTLDAETSKHLVQVLRMAPGDGVVLFDGRGHEVDGEIVDDHKRRATVRAVGAARFVAPAHEVHLLVGIPKGQAMDLAVRQATEAGVTHVHPVETERAVPRGGKADRWRTIAASAAAQCGRADVPEVLEPVGLAEALEAVAHVGDKRVAHPGGEALGRAVGDVAVLLGPEGGLTDAEVDQAVAAGFVAMGLGRWILRTSTAAAVAVAMVVEA